MRARFVAATAAAWLALSLAAAAIPYFPPPQPVYEAPIDRALENVAGMEGLEPAQRERLLGRLNLLAYARDNAAFTYVREGDHFNEAGSIACEDAPRGMRGSQEPGPVIQPGERCAALSFNIGPNEELPASAITEPSAAARARLEASATHYANAIALDGANLRARLGYAYALDRLGRVNDARKQLSTILKLGLPRLAEPQSEWEDHVVLTETAAHLAHLTANAGDQRKLEHLRERLQASQPMIYVTPVVVPLTDAPFARMIDTASDVAFDFAGTGNARAQGWLTPDAAWLVWDPEWRGDVRSGFDLIGQRTWAVFWNDGFEAMRALDDNRDGELTGAELGGLALWRDANSDGVSDSGEVLPVAAHGITGLRTRGAATRPGLITAPGGVRFEDGATRPLYDWTPGLGASGPVS